MLPNLVKLAMLQTLPNAVNTGTCENIDNIYWKNGYLSYRLILTISQYWLIRYCQYNQQSYIVVIYDYLRGDTMYTVRNLAEEVGVSKQAIMTRMEQLDLKKHLKQVGNKFMISDDIANIVKQYYHADSSPVIDVPDAPDTSIQVNEYAEKINELQHDLDVANAIVEQQKTLIEALQSQINDLKQDKITLNDIIEKEQRLHAFTMTARIEDKKQSKFVSWFKEVFAPSKEDTSEN